MRNAIFLLLVLCVGTATAQGIYKWVDAQGQVHYGERPPGEAPAKEMSIASPPSAAEISNSDNGDRLEKQRRLLETYAEERAEKEAQATKAAREKTKQTQNCAWARDRLRQIAEAGAVYTLDDKGERKIYNDAERTAATQRAEADVKKWCK